MKNLSTRDEELKELAVKSIGKNYSIEELVSRVKQNLEEYLDFFSYVDRGFLVPIRSRDPEIEAFECSIIMSCDPELIDAELKPLVQYLNNDIINFKTTMEKDSVLDLQKLNSIRESMSEFKETIIKKKDLASDYYQIFAVDAFRSSAIEFFKFLDEACERKQAKCLVLVSRNFVVPHAVTKFAFAGNELFTSVPMESFLNILGLKQEAVFSMFNRLLPKIKKLSPDRQENKTIKPEETPRKESMKNKEAPSKYS